MGNIPPYITRHSGVRRNAARAGRAKVNWTPAFAGVTLVSKACVLLTAARQRPEFASFAPRHEGMARRKAQNPMAPRPLPEAAGASRRASRGDFQHRPRFRRKCPAAILCPVWVQSLRALALSRDRDRRRLE
jgi:hypothetical protein